jgi:arabinofuranosyltransferase
VRLRRVLQTDFLPLALALAARLIPGPRPIDDAYITFRYAQNLLAGHGLVYNSGEWVLGTTTPLYALMMAGLGAVTGGASAPFPYLAWFLNSLADVFTCWLLIKLGEKLGHRCAGYAAAIIWAIAPWSVTFAIGGMETSFFVLLLVGTFYFHSKARPVPAAFLGSMGLITRPDALLFVGLIAAERVRRSLPWKRINPNPLPLSLRESIAFTAPLLLWGICGTILYGSPIPHSMFAKTLAYHLPTDAGLIRLLQHYATPFVGDYLFGTWWIGLGLVLFPILFGLGATRLRRERPGSWPIIAYPWIYLIAFAVANPLIFRWYLTPPLPAYLLGIFLGVDRISQDIKSNLPRIGFALLAVGLTLNGWTLHPDHGPTRPAPRMAYIKLELLYEQVGREVADKIQPDETLSAGDIGALGYFSGAHILDTIGLISPRSTSYYPLPDSLFAEGQNYAIPPDLVVELEPDYLVILEAYGRNGLLRDARFKQAYDLMETIPTDIYGSRGMLVFKRIPKP